MQDYDCRTCGACCVQAGEVEVGIDESAPKYLTRSVHRRMGFFSDDWMDRRCMAKDKTGRCLALRGEVGAQVRCSTYERRPLTCREFEPGSPECIESRIAAGLAVEWNSPTP